ncbi:MAG: ABC transporter substrate-binding protein [Candidatus Kaiserbacteria bacterium]|nr:ABC transporter substrate-binding protein [Candidatus Kaiserbacteria bacterium]
MRNRYLPLQPTAGLIGKLPASDRLIFCLLFLALVTQFFFVLHYANQAYVIETPLRGGTLREGTVGAIAHRNPIFANSPGEKTLATLLHAGLLRRTPTGTLTTELAEHWQQEGNRFTFWIRGTATFHDGFPVTANDVVHTISMIRARDHDPHSPWHDVIAEEKDEQTVVVTIPEGNLFFPEQFTAPILPQHVWKKIPTDQQKTYQGSGVHIGAGPFRYEREVFQDIEQPKSITLSAYPAYVFGRPYLDRIVIHLYGSPSDLVRAYHRNEIDALHSISPSEIALITQQGSGTLYTASTNRLFGIFFNTEDGHLLQDPFLRSVLSQYVDRNRIVGDVFLNFATATQAPLPSDADTVWRDVTHNDLAQTLEDIGWIIDPESGVRVKNETPLHLALVTPDVQDMRSIAQIITDDWRELGIAVTVTDLPPDLVSIAIRDGTFDATLYGYEAEKPTDLVPLWLSSDAVNIAMATNFGSPTLNKLLNDLGQQDPPERFSTGQTDRWRSLVYDEVKAEMLQSVPAVFLYSPQFLFVMPTRLKGIGAGGRSLGHVTDPSDRFIDVHTWHTRRERVWRILQHHHRIYTYDDTKQRQTTGTRTAVSETTAPSPRSAWE